MDLQRGAEKKETTVAIRVLLVDDESRFLLTTSTSLKKRGFEVSTATSGVEALEKIATKEFDVVVLDIKMPGIDGHRTLREMKKINTGIAVIMLTGHASMDSALEGLRDDSFAYLSKPCDIELLEDRIREAYAMNACSQKNRADCKRSRAE